MMGQPVGPAAHIGLRWADHYKAHKNGGLAQPSPPIAKAHMGWAGLGWSDPY